ncbi:hypothetical protein Lal_00029072 [Lupinus albus]|uniref:Uncharacterized protein n=1 Tax=Lupinus albus TaxID=3870 RepID=A0A6A4NMV1_LUPAL|nr:putative protein phosphatase 4 core regulatory subunit R2 [Lupinus albus]KAF1885183.1 hypothetical protein Lal_00029072 [Lupinus albus]
MMQLTIQNHVAVSDADADADASNHRDTVTQTHHNNETKINNDDDHNDASSHILQLIASTGNFWHDWDKLKSMLSFQLKQVLSEYAEAKMTSEEQYASLGESYSELVNKLDEALSCFIEGPPFTLQRICEILLDAKSIYPNLSKLALALEKNLLVTSTLTISADPYPQTVVQEQADQENASEEQKQESDSAAQNGIEPVVADKDEVMVEADVDDDMTVDTEAFEDINKSSETDSEPNANSA